jgi:hypothetical protein
VDVSVGHAILAAIAAGALDGTKDATKKAVADTYGALRDAITSKYGHHGDVTEAIRKVEQKPESVGRGQVLAEELENSGAFADEALVSQASALMDLIQSLPNMGGGGQIAHGTGIAQADRQSSASVTITGRTE